MNQQIWKGDLNELFDKKIENFIGQKENKTKFTKEEQIIH